MKWFEELKEKREAVFDTDFDTYADIGEWKWYELDRLIEITEAALEFMEDFHHHDFTRLFRALSDERKEG